MLAKARLALIALLLVVGHAAAPAAVRASTTQEITFEAIPDLPLVVFSIELEAVSSAGLPVSFGSETPLVCDVVDGNTVEFRDLGTCTIRAAQEGDETYSPAEPVLQSFLILADERLSHEILFEAIPNKSILLGAFTLQGVSSAGATVVYESKTPATCGVEGNAALLLHSQQGGARLLGELGRAAQLERGRRDGASVGASWLSPSTTATPSSSGCGAARCWWSAGE